jgi:hypothetical protein
MLSLWLSEDSVTKRAEEILKYFIVKKFVVKRESTFKTAQQQRTRKTRFELSKLEEKNILEKEEKIEI